MSRLEDYRRVMTEIVQQLMVILGPDVALSKARGVAGIFVGDDGIVGDLDGDPILLLKKLIDAYVSLSGPVVQKTIASLLKKYPSLASDLRENTP